MIRSLLKRSLIYFIGLTGSKILNVIVFILFARSLGPARFGDFILFVTIVQLITWLADCGLTQWYQTTAHHSDKQQLFARVIAVRLVTLAASVILITATLLLTHTFSVDIVVVAAISLIPESLLLLADGFYLENKQPLTVSLKNMSKIGIPLIGYVFLSNNFSLPTAIWLYFLGSAIVCVLFFPRKPFLIFFFSIHLSFSEVFSILRKSASYGLLTLTSYAYARADSLVIRYALNSTALGMYGAGYRYLEGASLIPTALSHNLFPAAAQKKAVTLPQLKKITAVMGVIGFVAALIVFANSNWLITGLLGKVYAPAVPILQIFSGVIFLFFVNAPLAAVVQSSPLLKQFLPYGAANTAVNLALNIVLVPAYGIVGAAWVMLATEVSGLLINISFVIKRYNDLA